jgi:Cys-tRNA(Pro)/Cys-tRNA(Cys) deacylase
MPASDSASAATKALAKAKIPHVLHSYDHDPSNHHFGDEGAAKLGFDPSIMLKTLVVGPLGQACRRRRSGEPPA